MSVGTLLLLYPARRWRGQRRAGLWGEGIEEEKRGGWGPAQIVFYGSLNEDLAYLASGGGFRLLGRDLVVFKGFGIGAYSGWRGFLCVPDDL